MHRIVVIAVAAITLSACSLDLSVPEQPQRAALHGTLDLGGHIPSSRVMLQAVRTDTGDQLTSLTDDNGLFRFGDLAPGLYEVHATLPGFAPLTVGPVKVPPGQEVDAGTLAPTWLGQTPAEARIFGQVIIESASGSLDGGKPSDAQGATVEFVLEGTGNTKVAEATVSAFGSFSARVPPGTYSLRASHPYFVTSLRAGVVAPEAGSVDLTGQPLVMQLNPAQLSGLVLKEIDGATMGQPAVGATITSDTGLTAIVDSTGHFVLGGLAGGVRTFTFALPGHHDSQENRVFTLGAGEKRDLDDLTLKLDRGDLIGLVEMGDSSPLEQVTVDIAGTGYASSASSLTTTPSQGRFTLSNVPVGSYNVRAARPSYIASVSPTVTVKANHVTDVGTLKLARVQGDFVIDDLDPTNTAGFTRTPNVNVVLSNVATAVEYRIAEGSSVALASATYSPFTSTTVPFTLSNGDGTKTIFFQYKDAQGNESQALSSSVVFDQTAPTNLQLSIVGGAGFTRIANSLPVTLSALDSSSGVAWVRLSGSDVTDGGTALGGPRVSYQRDTVFTRPTSADGVQPIYAQFTDNAGNVSAVISATIVVDTLAPTGLVQISDGPAATQTGFTNTVLAQLVETPGGTEPNGGSLQVRLANDAADLSSAVLQPVKHFAGWLLDPGSSPNKTVHYQFVDAAGNESAAGVATIIYDVTPPSLNVTLLSANPANSLTATLSLAVTEAVALSPTQALTVSESASFSGATPTAFPSNSQASTTLTATDGLKVLYVRVRDAAGNDSVTSLNVTVDRTAPTGVGISLQGSLADGTSSSTLSSSVAVTVTLTSTGATGVLLGDASLTSCPASVAAYSTLTGTIAGYTLLGSGSTRTVRACFNDFAGNTAGPVSASIAVDLTVPSGCALVLKGKRADGSASAIAKTALTEASVTLSSCTETPFEITYTEAATSCSASASYNWQVFDPLTASVSLSPADGPKVIRGCVRDRAHNTGSLTSATITLDATAPTAASVSLDLGARYVNLAQKTSRGGFIASVSGSATGATEWALAEAATPSSFAAITTQNFTFTSGDGVKTVRALFRDDVGNVTPVEVTGTIEFDTTPPTLTSVTIAGTLADGTRSTTTTATTAVTLTLVHSGGTQLFTGDASVVACPSVGYTPFTGASVSSTLAGSGSPRTVKVCVIDEAANPSALVTGTIGYDGTAPSGCSLVLQGYKADATLTLGPLAGQTALRDVGVAVGGCSETPVQIALSEGTISCLAGALLEWKALDPSTRFTVSEVDGLKTVRACVRDAALNTCLVTQGTVTLDTTPPTGGTSVTIAGGAPYVNKAGFVAGGSAYKASVAGVAPGAVDWAISESPNPNSFQSLATTSPREFTFTPGDGVKTLYAAFRDALLNTTSQTISDDIIFDTVAPSTTGVAVAVVGPTQNEFTNTQVVTVQVTNPPGDAVSAKVATASSVVDCVTADLTAASGQAVVTSYVTTLGAAEGLKRVCLQWVDAAGNPSDVSTLSGSAETYADTVTLDTTAPTSPQIVTSDAVLRLSHGASYFVSIASPSTDTNFGSYQKLGGQTTSWSTTSSPDGGLSFPFAVSNPPPYAETGVRNELRVRAIDQAGNTSGESSVFIIADTNPPDAISAVLDEWVDNGDSKSSIFWLPSASPDIAGYRLAYGSTNDNLTGTFANEGISPFMTPVQPHFTLSGLPNNTTTYAELEPVDLAGNVGPKSDVFSLQPGIISPNAVATLTLSGTPGDVTSVYPTQRLAHLGGWLYVATVATTASANTTMLHTVDMSGLESAIQRGSINPNPGLPVQTGPPLTFATDLVSQSGTRSVDLIVDPPWLFLASGKYVHVISLNDAAHPALYADIDVSAVDPSYRVNTLSMLGGMLIAQGPAASGGKTVAFSINLKRLYDGDATTKPLLANIGSVVVSNSSYDSAGYLTRDRWVNLTDNGTFRVLNISDGIDAEPASGTTWDVGDLLGTGNGAIRFAARPIVSGNMMYGGSMSSGLTAFNMNSVWAGPPYSVLPAVATAIFPAGQLDVVGGLAVMPDSAVAAIRIVDLSQLSSPVNAGVSKMLLSPAATLMYGHYAVAASTIGRSSYLRFIELATPRALTVRSTSVRGGHEINVRPGFIATTNGILFDMHAGSVPAMPPGGGSAAVCSTHSAWFDDVEVGAAGTTIAVRDIEKLLDRDSISAPSPGAPDTYVSSLGATTRVTGVAAWGNYLVTAQVRNPGGANNGFWLEVFDARDLRDRQPGTTLTTADTVAALQIVSLASGLGAYVLDVTVTDGRAAVSIVGGGNDTTGNNVMFVDLRAAFDDDATTSLSLASVQGVLKNIPPTNRTVISGNFAYLATEAQTTIVPVGTPEQFGFMVFAIPEVMDNDPLTKVGNSPPKGALLSQTRVESVVVYGSAAFLAPGNYNNGSGLYAIDVSAPLNPRTLGFYPWRDRGNQSCTPTGDIDRTPLTGIDVAGPRLYATPGDTFQEFNLE